MQLTEIVAWWGAVVATLVFVWDIYKWRQAGAVLEVTVAPNMEPYGNLLKQMTAKTYVVIEVVNKGSKKTTMAYSDNRPTLVRADAHEAARRSTKRWASRATGEA